MADSTQRGARSAGPRRAPLARVSDPAELRAHVSAWHDHGLRVGFVPTMGALHEGHLSLVRRAHELADRVVVSIFVNPTQFGQGEDYDAYPRDVAADCRMLAAEACHLVFLPSVETMYPQGESTYVDAGSPALGFEGDERPGHFRGVATVVAKLFHLVQPDVAIFGQKDAQQLAVVRRMVRDLHMPVEIVGAPIVREADGLALSSRNAYLSPGERRAAIVLSRSLAAAREVVEAGERSPEALRQRVYEILDAEPRGSTDYVAVVDADSFAPVESLEGRRVTVAIAFRLGRTRLLDNLLLDLRAEIPAGPARPADAPEGPEPHSVREPAPATF